MGDIYQTINFRVVPKIYWFPKRLGHVWVKIFEMPAPKTHGMDLCMYRYFFLECQSCMSGLHNYIMSKKLVSKFQHAWFLKIHGLTTSMLKSPKLPRGYTNHLMMYFSSVLDVLHLKKVSDLKPEKWMVSKFWYLFT